MGQLMLCVKVSAELEEAPDGIGRDLMPGFQQLRIVSRSHP